MARLERHLNNLRGQFGLPTVVAINHFTSDTAAEVGLLKQKMVALGSKAVVCKHWAEGGKGAEELGHEVLRILAEGKSDFRFLYDEHAPLWDKIKSIATRIYGAADITADIKARCQFAQLSEEYSHFPVCILRLNRPFPPTPTLRVLLQATSSPSAKSAPSPGRSSSLSSVVAS